MELQLFAKIKKDLVSTHSLKPSSSTAQDLHKIKKKKKKNLEHPFQDIGKTETCAKLKQKILNSMVVSAHQIFQLFR